MAKQRSKKGKGSYVSYAAEGRVFTNAAKRKVKHLERHPNDVQSVRVTKTKYKTSAKKRGHYPEQKRYVYDGAGHKLLYMGPAPKISK